MDQESIVQFQKQILSQFCIHIMSALCGVAQVGVTRNARCCGSACSLFFNNCSTWCVRPTVARPYSLEFSAQCYRAQLAGPGPGEAVVVLSVTVVLVVLF